MPTCFYLYITKDLLIFFAIYVYMHLCCSPLVYSSNRIKHKKEVKIFSKFFGPKIEQNDFPPYFGFRLLTQVLEVVNTKSFIKKLWSPFLVTFG